MARREAVGKATEVEEFSGTYFRFPIMAKANFSLATERFFLSSGHLSGLAVQHGTISSCDWIVAQRYLHVLAPPLGHQTFRLPQ